MPMIRKSLLELSRDNLSDLLRSPWIEDEQVDFKVTIPHREGPAGDPWRNAAASEGRRIKEYGRDQLLATLVAFANSYGGDLVIGIREAKSSQPGVADGIDPLPACEDAAHRLAQAATACIEPPLPSLEVRGIVTDADGSGVVVMRTPRSRMAPHRLTTTKDCYHRVRHETLPMTMRQIQDLTFNVVRGLEAVDRRFEGLRRSFQEWAARSSQLSHNTRLGLRVAVVPLSDLYVEHVHNVTAVQPTQRNARLRMQPTAPDFPLNMPFTVYNWRPTLRGTAADMHNEHSHARLGVYCDGGIKYEFLRDVSTQSTDRPYVLYPGWYFAMIVNAVEAAEKFRTAAGATAVEYALEAEVIVAAPLPVLRFGNNLIDPAGELPVGIHCFPRYVIGPSATFREAYTLIYRDFWNSIEIDAREDQFLLDAPLA